MKKMLLIIWFVVSMFLLFMFVIDRIKNAKSRDMLSPPGYINEQYTKPNKEKIDFKSKYVVERKQYLSSLIYEDLKKKDKTVFISIDPTYTIEAHIKFFYDITIYTTKIDAKVVALIVNNLLNMELNRLSEGYKLNVINSKFVPTLPPVQ